MPTFHPPSVRAPLAALATVSVLVISSTAIAQQSAPLDSVAQRFSYVVGLQLGQRLSSQGLSGLDAAAVAAGINDIMNNREPQLSMEQMQQAATEFQAQVTAELEQKANDNKAAEAAYLAANREKEGVIELPSGLQYSVVTAGSGKQPAADGTVTVHYRGTLIDGTEFDSSYKRGEPAQLAINQVIQGWQEVLPMMKEGDKWNVVIPATLAYGENGAGSAIGPNQLLLFEIELVAVN